MNLLALLSTLLLSFHRLTISKPIQGILETKDSGETDFLQDDIVYKRRTQRSAMSCSGNCYWPRSEDGLVKIPVNISPEFSVEHQDVIIKAMEEFVTLTCIRFIKHTVEYDYINIVSGDRCWSYFGKIGGRQQLSLLKNGCMYKGLIQHELNHALGFLHEQTRSDRDNYVKINLEYVAKESPVGWPEMAITWALGCCNCSECMPVAKCLNHMYKNWLYDTFFEHQCNFEQSLNK